MVDVFWFGHRSIFSGVRHWNIIVRVGQIYTSSHNAVVIVAFEHSRTELLTEDCVGGVFGEVEGIEAALAGKYHV